MYGVVFQRDLGVVFQRMVSCVGVVFQRGLRVLESIEVWRFSGRFRVGVVFQRG